MLGELNRVYGDGEWRVPLLRERGSDPYRVLVSTVLSHRTRDEATAVTWDRLQPQYPTIHALARARVSKVERLVRGVGISKNKARGLVELAKQVEARFAGTVPATMADLQTLPLVGPKTASAVRVFAFGIPSIPVDSHIHRVANRLGVVATTSPEKTATELERVVPRRYWEYLNPVLVGHGKNLCKRVRPRCAECPLRAKCRTGRGSLSVNESPGSE